METKHADYNIHNYVQDMEYDFDEKPFSEIDGLVMTQIANMDLGGLGIDLGSGNSKSFATIWDDIKKYDACKEVYEDLSPDNQKLIEELANSPRFQNMMVSDFVKDPAKNHIEGFEVDEADADVKMEQFAAVTITYEQNGDTYNFVSFRATDDSADGWSEDLAMLFSMETQAQHDSVKYLNIIAENKEGYITGGGHSKGGGDFEYAYLFCNDDTRDRIVKGYVYDSPGLSEEVLENTQFYDRFLEITNGTFICPQDSIVGQLLHEADNATFVYSVESGFLQHDPYSWEIDSKNYTFCSYDQTEMSKYLNKALDEAVRNMSQEEREALFSFVSYLLYEGDGLEGTIDMFATGWKNEDGGFNWEKLDSLLGVITDDWNSMTSDEQQEFIDSLTVAVVAVASVSFDYLKDDIDEWVEQKIVMIKEKVQEAWNSTKEWFIEKRDVVSNFLTNIYTSIKIGFNKVREWVKGFFYGGKYASSHPQIKLDTYKLRNYAQRLQSVNRRINNLDTRLDNLYWKVGLLDLWDLMTADLMTSYSWRLLRCSNYLNDTASDFDAIETKLVNSL